MSWGKWLIENVDSLGINQLFAFFGAIGVLWSGDPKATLTVKQASLILFAGQFVASVAFAFFVGFMDVSPFFAFPIGAVAGLVGLPIIRSVARSGERFRERTDDIADFGIDRITGRQQDRKDEIARRSDDRLDETARRSDDRKDARGRI